jgi:hypothetical protein
MSPLEDDPAYKLGLLAGGFAEFKASNEREHDSIVQSIGQLRDSFLDRLGKMEERLVHKLGEGTKSHGACRDEIDDKLNDHDNRLRTLEAKKIEREGVRRWWGRSWQYVVGGAGVVSIVLGALASAHVL